MRARTLTLLPFLLLAPLACGNDAGSGAEPQASAHTDAGVEPQKPPVLVIESLALKNGLHVDLASGACGPMLGVAMLVGLGHEHDPPGRSGMMRVVERVWSTALASKNAKLDVAPDHSVVSFAVTVADLPAEVEAVAKWMSYEPTEEDLKRAREAVLADLAQLEGKDAARTARRLAEESLRPAPNEGRRGGVASDVEAITLEELQTFFKEHVAAGHSRLTVVGAFDAKAVKGQIETALGSAPAGSAPMLGEAQPATVRGTLVMGDAPTAIAIAVEAPQPGEPKFPAFLAMAARLNEAASKSWKLHYSPLRAPALLFVTGTVPASEQPEPAAKLVRNEINKLLAPELSAADDANVQRQYPLVAATRLDDSALCTADPLASAVARARRAYRGLEEMKLDDTNRKEADARARFGAKRAAAVIAGGTIAAPPRGEEREPKEKKKK